MKFDVCSGRPELCSILTFTPGPWLEEMLYALYLSLLQVERMQLLHVTPRHKSS